MELAKRLIEPADGKKVVSKGSVNLMSIQR